jgi:NADPH:quinone reductase-like Zn-dependent oxidoreductase
MADVEKPTPGAGEALVKVLATSVNAADWHSMRGQPLFSRATLGILRPKYKVLGVDIAGRVEEVGSGVTNFRPGDEVYARPAKGRIGTFAEFIAVAEDDLAPAAPDNLCELHLTSLAGECTTYHRPASPPET